MKKIILPVGALALGLLAGCGQSFAGTGAPSLEGAWQPSDIGTRIEITGDTMLILWRNTPALETRFSVTEEDGKYVLHLENTELRHASADLRMKRTNRANDGMVYAHVTGCWVEDGTMHLLKRFDIAGDREEILKPTNQSRYGDVTIVTEEMLPRLRGLWRTKDGDTALEFVGETLRCRNRGLSWDPEEIPVAVVRYNYAPEEIHIVHKDPAMESVFYFSDLRYDNGKLVALMHVADANSIEFVFEKAK